MGSFFFKLIIFLLLVMGPYYYFQYGLLVQRDAYYWKATQRSNHLILGGSRAFKGILPSVLKEELQINEPIVNFAFNGLLSPYGEPYFNAIRRKLTNTNANHGIYILSVAPGNIMDFQGGGGKREQSFRFYKLWDMNANPNVEYVFRNPHPGPALLVRLLHHHDVESGVQQRVYKDGAQSTFVDPDRPPDIVHKEHLLRHTMYPSVNREEYLKRTIDFLATRGDVFLVRIPVSPQMLAEESEIYPDFNQKIIQLAAGNDRVRYFNYNDTLNTAYRYSDGHHHLEGKSAQLFSTHLARRIKQNLAR